MPSPTCEVQLNGAGPWLSTTNGVNVAAADDVVVRLASHANVDMWELSVIGTDETSALADLTVVQDPLTFTASFTMPAGTGKTYILQSKINDGLDGNRRANEAYSTTMGLYMLTGSSKRVVAVNETFEGDAVNGWIASVNAAIRAV